MHPISKEIFDNYQVRKTKQQKTEFIEFLQNELKGLKFKVETGGVCKSRNIVVGNLEKAKYILTAHYDTAPVLPFPNFLAPKNMIAYLGYCLLLCGLFFIVVVLTTILTTLLFNNEIISLIISEAIMFSLIGYMFIGKANKHTANDNTSGVVTLIEVLHNEKLKDEVCCVFFDHEEVGLFGSSFFAKKHKDILKDKLVINFDCVGDGDTIMLIYSKIATQYKTKLETSFKNIGNKEFFVTSSKSTLYPSDQANFKNNIGVASFKKNKWIGYYMDKIHTSKDTTLDMKNIEVILSGLEVFICD